MAAGFYQICESAEIEETVHAEFVIQQPHAGKIRKRQTLGGVSFFDILIQNIRLVYKEKA